MLEFALWAAILILGLAVLVKSADFLIRSAEVIGLSFGFSPFIIGVTVVGLGTSLPELAAGIYSVLAGASEIAVATAVGSNVTNILLVLSVAAIIGRGLQVAHELIRVDLPFLFGSALLLALFAFDGAVGRLEGLLCLGGLAVYLTYAATNPEEPATTVGLTAAEVVAVPQKARATALTWLVLAASTAFLQLGAYFTVSAVSRLSEIAAIGSEVVAASVIALGTSLPELTVSIQTARAGKPELAVGNVIGSNIFNALGVVGASALFGTVIVPEAITGFALPFMMGVTILGFFVLQEREMTRWDGWLLLLLYTGFNAQLYGLL
jgi:cation:H+ antiporter